MYRAPALDASPFAIVAFGPFVFAVDRTSGKRVWQFQEFTARWVRVVASDEHVVVAGRRRVACLRYADGALLWDVESPAIASSLLVDGDAVLLGGAGEVACHELATGALRWHDAFAGLGLAPVALAFPGKSMHVDETA